MSAVSVAQPCQLGVLSEDAIHSDGVNVLPILVPDLIRAHRSKERPIEILALLPHEVLPGDNGSPVNLPQLVT